MKNFHFKFHYVENLHSFFFFRLLSLHPILDLHSINSASFAPSPSSFLNSQRKRTVKCTLIKKTSCWAVFGAKSDNSKNSKRKQKKSFSKNFSCLLARCLYRKGEEGRGETEMLCVNIHLDGILVFALLLLKKKNKLKTRMVEGGEKKTFQSKISSSNTQKQQAKLFRRNFIQFNLSLFSVFFFYFLASSNLVPDKLSSRFGS